MRFLSCLILTFLLFTSAGFAQTKALPKMKKGESYTKVREKLIAAGWKPYHKKGADECMAGDARCEGRPEMEACAGTGMANCRFLWKRKGSRTLAIFTVGENAGYDGRQFQ